MEVAPRYELLTLLTLLTLFMYVLLMIYGVKKVTI